jgi:hypothetical protein
MPLTLETLTRIAETEIRHAPKSRTSRFFMFFPPLDRRSGPRGPTAGKRRRTDSASCSRGKADNFNNYFIMVLVNLF